MTNACSRAARSSAKHVDCSHANRPIPARQRSALSIGLNSSSATQRDDGQMLASCTVVHREFEASTTPPIDLRMRSRAREPRGQRRRGSKRGARYAGFLPK